MLPGLKSSQGALLITTVPPNPEYFVGGIAHNEIGAIYARDDLPPQAVVNGFGARMSGALCIRYGYDLTQAVWNGGLPFDDEGRLCGQLNVAFGIHDTFVGGIRVGPFGGVYFIDVAPPAEFGFSNGFSNGFDIS